MYNTGHYVQSMPKSVSIQNYPLTCINQEICEQKLTLYAIFWKFFTFMKFLGDYYDIHEKKIIFISNASWEILNRTFFSRISRYNGG